MISQMESCQSLKNVNITRSSTHAYLDYRRRMQNRLANLNNNVSSMIQESFSGIDDICQRVRECLNTVDLGERKKAVSFIEEPSEYEIVEERSKSADETAHENGETTDSSVIEKLDEDERRESQSASPYATVINCNDKGDSNMNEDQEKQFEEIVQPPTESIMDGVTAERYNVLENFRETILSNVVTTSYDDFDMMNKIIENINAEIKDFSQATISGHLESSSAMNQKAIIKRAILNPRFSKPPPPIRRPTPSKMKNLNPNLLSENELDCILFNKKSDDPFIMPDVYRKRAFTNLYQRLMVQLEANDSLMLFQKLMNRDRNKNRKAHKSFYNPSSKLLDIPIMNYYPKKTKSNPNSQDGSKKTELSKKYTDSLWFSHFKGKSPFMKTSSSRKKARKESRRNLRAPINYSVKSGVDKRKTKRPSGSKKSSKANSMSSIHDKACPAECPCKMVVHNDQPLTPSTKCRLHWMRAKTSLAPTRKLQFLDILDDLTNRDLLPLQSEYPRRDNQPTDAEQKDIHSTYLYKLMYGKQGTKNVWKQLLEPSLECSEKNCKQCKPRTRDSSPEKSTNDNKEKNSSHKYSRHEILKKLSPYMNDPERKGKFYQTVTVMPVHVYYDNYKPVDSPTRLSSSRNTAYSPKRSPGFKEVKGVRRAEWTPSGNSKPMKVVFDSLPKKIEVPPLALQPNKPTAISARIPMEKTLIRSSTSKSFSPKSFAPFCRVPNQPRPIHVEMKDVTKFAKIHNDLEKIKNDVEANNLNEAERKLWATKYQKTVGQQLVSFVERQELPPPPALPKYCISRSKASTPDSILSPTKDVTPHKNILFNLEGLKKKNSAIQNNIQKAIHVIEAKMVDILSTDGETTNVEAFDAMEKEITGVLSLMKSKKRVSKATSSKNVKDGANTETSLEEEVNTISDELFKKLEKILDSERSSASIRSGGTDVSNKYKFTPKREEKRVAPKKDEGKHAYRKEENKPTPKKEDVKKQRPSSSRTSGKWDNKKQSPLPKRHLGDDNSSVDSGTPTKLTATSSSNKTIAKPKATAGQKSKPTTPKSARTVSQSPTKTWDNILSMPCGDQNTEKSKKQGITNNDNLIGHTDSDAKKSASQIYENLILEKSQGDGAVREVKAEKNAFKDIYKAKREKPMDDENEQKLSKKVRFEEFLNDTSRTEEYAMTTSEENSSLLETAKDDVSSSYYTPNQSPKLSPKVDQIVNQESSTSFAEQVNRIIKRVEDIYTHLDDMHNTSSEENVKKFKEKVPEVRSEIFLTPFMQAVKEKRKVPEKGVVQKSPSYYNVINFLDSLKDIQDEKPIEMHTARLCYHVNVYHQPMVYDQAQIEHTAEILPVIPAKPSCIKKMEEEQKSKQKKVHFLVSKEEKCTQATVCTMHKQKILRISSQQFPQSEDVAKQGTPAPENFNEANTDQGIFLDTEEINEKGKSNILTEAVAYSENQEILEGASKEKTPEDVEKKDYDINIPNKIDLNNIETNIGAEEYNNLDIPGTNDKPVQVYCHTVDLPQNKLECDEQTEESNANAENYTPEEMGSCEKQNNLNMTKKDKSNQSICQMHKDNNTDESIKAVNTDATYNERGINTEDMDNSESTRNISNGTSLASLFYDGSCEMLCPKVVKEHIDIRDGNYGEHSIINVKNSLQKLKQNKIVVFREVTEVPNLLKSAKDLNLPAKLNKRRLDKRKELRLMRKSSIGSVKKSTKDIQSWGENVVLLKSFYAIVYILMFTALSMDYRCL